MQGIGKIICSLLLIIPSMLWSVLVTMLKGNTALLPCETCKGTGTKAGAIWNPTANQLAQTSHTFIATTIVCLSFIFPFQPEFSQGWISPQGWGWIYTAIFALVKDYGIDLWIEDTTFVWETADIIVYNMSAGTLFFLLTWLK